MRKYQVNLHSCEGDTLRTVWCWTYARAVALTDAWLAEPGAKQAQRSCTVGRPGALTRVW